MLNGHTSITSKVLLEARSPLTTSRPPITLRVMAVVEVEPRSCSLQSHTQIDLMAGR